MAAKAKAASLSLAFLSACLSSSISFCLAWSLYLCRLGCTAPAPADATFGSGLVLVTSGTSPPPPPAISLFPLSTALNLAATSLSAFVATMAAIAPAPAQRSVWTMTLSSLTLRPSLRVAW